MLSRSAQPGVLLIADDDEDMRVLFRTLMGSRGHRVLEAEDGERCMALAAGAELVALDLRMPLLDGFEVAARLRADPATRMLPLLAVTALAEVDCRDRALGAGCDEVLVKPFSPRLLLARVELLLEQSREVRRMGSRLRDASTGIAQRFHLQRSRSESLNLRGRVIRERAAELMQRRWPACASCGVPLSDAGTGPPPDLCPACAVRAAQ
jgi:CheY-like chemotaxis protein